MPLTAIASTGLGHNVAWRAGQGTGTACDVANFNAIPNSGQSIVVINTGATPGLVSIVVQRTVDGKTIADYSILNDIGGALAATSTYVVGLPNIVDYGTTVTLKATNASTTFAVYSVAP
jgi:hypothetical protein